MFERKDDSLAEGMSSSNAMWGVF